MTKLLDTCRHAGAGASLIVRRGNAPKTHAESVLRRRLEIKTARRLRRSLAAVINEVDTAVMEDLMRILRRLSKAEQRKPTEYDMRLKLSLDLMNMTFSKSKPPSPGVLLWNLSQIYKQVDPFLPPAHRS